MTKAEQTNLPKDTKQILEIVNKLKDFTLTLKKSLETEFKTGNETVRLKLDK